MQGIQQYGDEIHEALFEDKKKNKNEVIFNIATNTNLSQRITISQYYQAAYEHTLYDDLKSKLSGDYGYIISLMFLSPLEFCVKMLKKAVPKDESCIFEMLTSKSVEELKLIESSYFNETKKNLQEELGKGFSGTLKKNILNLFTTQRTYNSAPNKNECETNANTLIEIGESNWVNDENVFREIFLKKSPEELILIARYYKKKTKNNLLDVIDKKLSGKNKTLLREVLYNNILPHELFAEKVNKSIKGLGTDEELLSRVLVSRSELDMAAIRSMYVFKYKNTLKEDVMDDTSGFYQKICVFLGDK